MPGLRGASGIRGREMAPPGQAAAMPAPSRPRLASSLAWSPWSMNLSGRPSISSGLTMPSAAIASATAEPAPPMIAPSSTVANMRFVKPLDVELLKQLAADHDYLVTVEEGAIMGGAGSAVAEAMAAEGIVKPLLMLGMPDKFIDHGDHAKLLASLGLDGAGIAAAVKQRFGGDEPRLSVVNNA